MLQCATFGTRPFGSTNAISPSPSEPIVTELVWNAKSFGPPRVESVASLQAGFEQCATRRCSTEKPV